MENVLITNKIGGKRMSLRPGTHWDSLSSYG